MRTERRSQDERRAEHYKRDERMERLLELKENDPERFDRVSADLKVQLGYYTNAKEAAERLR